MVSADPDQKEEEGFKRPHAGPGLDKKFYCSYCFLS